jgi:hypothetical protein
VQDLEIDPLTEAALILAERPRLRIAGVLEYQAVT